MAKPTFERQRVFHDGNQMIVAKAGDKHHEVPDELMADFIADGSIEEPKAKKKPAPSAEDDDGGDAPRYTMAYKPVGTYLISGPGLDEPEVVKGKEAAEKRLAALEAGLVDDGAPND